MAPPLPPLALYVSGSNIEICTSETWDDIKKDPRGLVLMWEPPERRYKYIMGMDSSEGITGWNRATRTENDHKVDNGVVEIFRPNAIKSPLMKMEKGQLVQDIDPVTKAPKFYYKDLQVCEFAAPCDAVEIARIANVLGRIYAGTEDDQCKLIWEAWPGCGMLATQELIRLGYGNLWMWEYIDSAAEETNRMGWRSTHESQKLLWYRSRRHLLNRGAILRSQFLVDEYSNAEIDMNKMRAMAAHGYHDDRMMATNLCFWGGHEWTYDADRTEEKVTTAPVLDFQRYAPVLDEYHSYKDWVEDVTAEMEID